MRREAAVFILCGVSGSCAPSSHPVKTVEQACAVATARVTASRRLPTRHVAYCDPASPDASPRGYWVTSLRAHCREDVCGSTNMGWFAVRKTNGQVLDFDVAEGTIRRPVADR